ncbi:MAG: MBL fold metallo-hydrolase [Duncaniella sp.]|nr:MBL fold metallo-hydrolase [Duncaniella sp.]MDE6582668.1 MBL fold metallo-hydrolase [Duncaniella sp.]
MQLTFLGTGTSTGVPTPACHCNVCTSTDFHDKRLRASALVETAGKHILIDCGPDFRYQALREGIERIDAVLVTHSHYDHVGGFDDLRPYCAQLPDNRMPVYCTADVAADFHARMPYCFAEHPYPGVPKFDIHIIDKSPFSVAGIEVIPFPVMHRNLEIRGYRMGNLAYITDCLVLPEESCDIVEGVDTLVINALRFKPHYSHMSLSQALELISRLHPRKAYLIHMSHDIGMHSALESQLPHGVLPAYDGLKIHIQDRTEMGR